MVTTTEPGLTQGQAPPAPGEAQAAAPVSDQLSVTPLQCGQVETYTPRDQRVQGVLQKPGSTQLWSTHCPEDPRAPSCAASDTSSNQAPPSPRHPVWQERKPGLTNQSFCPDPTH